MITPDLASTAPVSTRRRTNSVAASCDLSCKKKQPESLQRPATEESNLLALGELPKPTRFRRSSFALSGERPTQLDGLVKEAAEHTTQVAASREAAKITSMVSPPSGVTKFQLDMGNTDGDSDDGSRKISVATLVPSSFGISDRANQNCSFPCSRKTSDSAWGLSVNDAEHPFVWYNTDAFSQNPLSSELVRKYLAKIATENAVPEPDVLTSASPSSGSAVMCGNLSGLMQLATSSVSSMTMPVHQIRRACALHARSPNAKWGLMPYDLHPSTRTACFSDRNAITDTNYSSGLSDAEHYHHYHHLGYQSDNYMRDVASEARQLRMTGQRLEADYHRSTGSLPRTRKTRSRSKSGVLQANTLSPSATPASVHSSRFDLTHVYEGLPASGFVSSNGTGSTAASVTSSPASRLPCDTPPCSPSTGSPLDSDHQNLLSSTNGLTRLRLFFDHWKPQVGTDENSNYIYLDQEAQERRANARASNVIAPVSF
ncbi:hypothetical protein D915_007073 [Fasciola hepatica]|uniref:Uncharacterized protein n=1 Tax=Fasciola hepatica TaxID=6192 RepID=A0A4E0R3X8_FASHE|nr:hypothetical protein D915_007073 [Fasciola hepatica]